MSYGVLGTKSAQVLVESTGASGGAPADLALGRLLRGTGQTWTAGRITLTALHLTFIPNRIGVDRVMTEIHLLEVAAVELGGGRVNRAIGVRTQAHLLLARLHGAASFAQQLARAVEDLKRDSAR